MGVVYLAHDTRLERDVAIKALPEELAGDPGRLERFEREARTLASLNHPNIGAIHGVEEQGGKKYLVLEYVEGETLADRLDQGPLPVDEAVEVAVEIARGLEAAHEAGVIHRDLKPANIKITPENKVKVLDFGLAKTDDGQSSGGSGLSQSPTMTSPVPQHSPTIPGAILGTAAYMSPEQARGRRVDRRTDIWSFGVILYEMLTGASPFVGETASDSIGAVLHKSFDLDRLPDGTPPRVRRVLERCIERDASLRYRDIGDVRVELLRAGREEADPVVAGSHGRLGALVVCVVVATALVLGGTAVWFLRPVPEPGVVKADILVATEEEPLDNIRAQISPDGRCVAYIVDDKIHIRDLRSFESQPVAGTDGVVSLFWSPDSKSIGYLRKNAVYKLKLATGGSVKVCDSDESLFGRGSGGWTKDGRILYRVGEQIMAVPALGGEPTVWLQADTGSGGARGTEMDFHEVRVISGTDAAVFITHLNTLETQIEVFDGQTRVVVTKSSEQMLSSPAYSPTGHILYTRGSGESTLWAVGFDPARMRVTGEPFQVMEDAEIPSVSADGTLALQRGGAPGEGGSLVWIEAEGGDLVKIGVGDGLELRIVGDPSPDGLKILVTAGDSLQQTDAWIADLERNTIHRLTSMETRTMPVGWSRDGREVVLATFDPTSPDGGVHTLFLAADGTGQTREPIAGRVTGFDREWETAFVLTDSTDDAVVLQRVWLDVSREPEFVFRADRDDSTRPVQPSPDGDLLLILDNSSDPPEVFCERIDGKRRRYQVSTDGGRSPMWSPDGAWVYYRRAETAEVMRVAVKREPPTEPDGVEVVKFGIPEPVFDMEALGLRPSAGWSPTPDNKRFLALAKPEDEESDPAHYSIISNWFEEFRDR